MGHRVWNMGYECLRDVCDTEGVEVRFGGVRSAILSVMCGMWNAVWYVEWDVRYAVCGI